MARYTKLQAAEAQLRTAVRLFFGDSDAMAVETLCAAVLGILHPLAEKHNVRGLLNNPDLIPQEMEAIWNKKLHEVPNYLKHADRDWDVDMEYNEAVLPYRLFEATALYDKLTKVMEYAQKSERYVVVYQFWFGLMYPQLVKKEQTPWTGYLKEIKEKLPPNAGKGFFLSLIVGRPPSHEGTPPANSNA